MCQMHISLKVTYDGPKVLQQYMHFRCIQLWPELQQMQYSASWFQYMRLCSIHNGPTTHLRPSIG